mmetsp:Transcript_26744/g.37704  ORF Transcript_26744/g.37704 Transcript_26744/m.37704 type:complete len:293 (-) Transcript_26744:30-908(-)
MDLPCHLINHNMHQLQFHPNNHQDRINNVDQELVHPHRKKEGKNKQRQLHNNRKPYNNSNQDKDLLHNSHSNNQDNLCLSHIVYLLPELAQVNPTCMDMLPRWQVNRKLCVVETHTCMEYLNRAVVCLDKWYEEMHRTTTILIKVVECILVNIWVVVTPWKMEEEMVVILVDTRDAVVEEAEAVDAVVTKVVVEEDEVASVTKRDVVVTVVVDTTTVEITAAEEAVVVTHLNKTLATVKERKMMTTREEKHRNHSHLLSVMNVFGQDNFSRVQHSVNYVGNLFVPIIISSTN